MQNHKSNLKRFLYIFLRYEKSPLAFSWSENTEPFNLATVLDRYYDRNETLSLEMIGAPLWEYAPSSDFTVNLNIKIPTSSVEYVAPMPELLKQAWIQYLAFLIPFTGRRETNQPV